MRKQALYFEAIFQKSGGSLSGFAVLNRRLEVEVLAARRSLGMRRVFEAPRLSLLFACFWKRDRILGEERVGDLLCPFTLNQPVMRAEPFAALKCSAEPGSRCHIGG